MANVGGETFDDAFDGRDAQRPDGRDDVEEPTLLGADWPEPSTWGPVLGAGGEELVPLDFSEPEGLTDEEPRPADRRRPPAATASGTGTASLQRTRSLTWRVGRGAVTALLLAGGLAGLAILLVSAVFSLGGDPPARDEGTAIATASLLRSPDGHLTEMRKEKARLQARLREAARDRRAAVAAARRDERRRARARDAANENRPTPGTAEVVTTTPSPPEPPLTPAPSAATASPAEREFTPGPWNES